MLMKLRLQLSWSDSSWNKNVITFYADMSSSLHVNNKKKDIVVGEDPTQDLDNATSKTKYPNNFTESEKRFMLSLHYNESNNLFNAVKMYQYKAKDLEIKPYPLCLGNISKHFTLNNLKKVLKRNIIFLLLTIMLLIRTIF